MQNAIKYDALYTYLSAYQVIEENKSTRAGVGSDTADDRRSSITSHPAFIGFGAKYAHPVTTSQARSQTRLYGSKQVNYRQ